MRKLTTGQSEDYTVRCLLEYDYIQIHNRSVAVDLSRRENIGWRSKINSTNRFYWRIKKNRC